MRQLCSKSMRILGIETSCDDTGIAVVEIKGKKNPRFSILSNMVSSQIQIHEKYGGVYPLLAKREHEKNLPITLAKALQKAGISENQPNIHAVAITGGPGLSPCLWTGINFVKKLAHEWKIPVMPVDHIEGHLLIALLRDKKPQAPNPPPTGDLPQGDKSQANPKSQIRNTRYKILDTKNTFPAIALIVSGGHTQLMLVKDIGKYKIIGETRDDAAGEAFDKTARILGLGFPGGPAIAREAAQWKSEFQNSNFETNSKFKIKLPRPMINTKDYDFSFSGLKTAVLYDYQSRPENMRKSKEYVQEMAAEIQQAIVDVLIFKTLKAAKEFRAKSIILGGGVAANVELRRMFEAKLQTLGIRLLVPPKNLSTDNGAMIAVAGYFNWLKKKYYIKELSVLEAKPNLRIA